MDEQASLFAEKFDWSSSFLDINGHLLEKYRGAADAGEILRIQNEYLDSIVRDRSFFPFLLWRSNHVRIPIIPTIRYIPRFTTYTGSPSTTYMSIETRSFPIHNTYCSRYLIISMTTATTPELTMNASMYATVPPALLRTTNQTA